MILLKISKTYSILKFIVVTDNATPIPCSSPLLDAAERDKLESEEILCN